MYSKEELKVLDKVAKEMFGISFRALDEEDQDAVYCYAADNGLL